VEKELPGSIFNEIFVILKAGTDKAAFEKEIKNKYSNLNASDIQPMMKYTLDPIPGTLLPMTQLLIIVFIVFSGVTILNIIIMDIRDNRRNFGIMKALGFTYKDIRNQYLYRISILTILSIIFACTLNLVFSRKILGMVLSKLDVLIISGVTMLLLIMAMVLLILGVALICCKAIKNTKPTELTEE